MKEINNIIAYEASLYNRYIMPTRFNRLKASIKKETYFLISKWQKYSRLADYYKGHPFGKCISFILYLYYVRKKNNIGCKLGLEISTSNIGKGLLIYHANNVVNGYAIIGKNCHLHGGNVIGNAGPDDPEGCPTIGNNVMLGAGAKVIGRVTIADNIKIAAGAVVVHSFTEPGITIAGIPAKKVSK